MKIIPFLSVLIITVSLHAQSTPHGVFQKNVSHSDSINLQERWVIVNDYLVVTAYDVEQKQFYYTYGGPCYIKDGFLKVSIEFSSNATYHASEQLSLAFKNLGLNIQKDAPAGDLNGVWVMTARKTKDSLRTRPLGSRRTLKILSKSTFQWVAFDIEKNSFKGTGGGNYKTKDGQYTEHIEFFSRDSSRVGSSLKFDYLKQDNQWIHSGFSSEEKPLYEIWTPLKIAEKQNRY